MTLAVAFLYTLLISWLLDRWLGDEPRVWQAMPSVVPWLARAALTALALVVLVDLVGTVDDVLHPFQFG
jgi:hypothetical protein